MSPLTSAPRHCQLMDPAEDPQEFIESSIYWYPLLFPTRTEVLEHTLLCNGNGYAWGQDGNLRSEFAHIEPNYARWYEHEEQAREYEEEAAREKDPDVREFLLTRAAKDRAEDTRLHSIRADYQHLARTYGPVRLTEQDYPDATRRKARMITSADLRWTLLGEALSGEHPLGWALPERITPAWQAILSEVRDLFADLFTEQGQLF